MAGVRAALPPDIIIEIVLSCIFLLHRRFCKAEVTHLHTLACGNCDHRAVWHCICDDHIGAVAGAGCPRCGILEPLRIARKVPLPVD